MICGIGIDSVEIERCALWQEYTQRQLERVFSVNEINYCFAHAPSTAQRLAARFAAKEASYKALCTAYPNFSLPFLTACPLIQLIHHEHQAPTLFIDWNTLHHRNSAITPLTCHISVTHTRTHATAVVILEKS